ncbi:hypothetical protein L1049_024504 [Liquidambar formosana]|uniref:RPN1 N-terminal domain-containing protein n=1 Tax=Liquidambar formosana TaxID=63359 RepID=A0AAP0RVW8_LIQFO
MAAYAKHFFFPFLLVLFSIVQARESRFFSKVTHSTVKKVPVLVEAPAPAPEPAQPESTGYGYGLYGHGSNEVPTTTTTTTTPTTATNENEILAEEFASENYKESETGYTNSNYNNNGYTNTNTNSNYNNNGYTNTNTNTNTNYNANLYQNSYSTNGYQSNYNNNGYPSNYNNNAYVTEPQGMSDTRSVENGKYYYDAKKENAYLNGYESGTGSTQNEVYYGNKVNSNEFNSMEEYERQQEYQGNQERVFLSSAFLTMSPDPNSSSAGGATPEEASTKVPSKDPKKKKDEKKEEDLSDEDIALKQQLELYVERTQDADSGVQKLDLERMRQEIRASMSSMTSVPMKKRRLELGISNS